MIVNKKEKIKMSQYDHNFQLTYKQIKSSYKIVKHYLDNVKPLLLQHNIRYFENLALNPEYAKAVLDSEDHNIFLQDNYLDITGKYIQEYENSRKLEKENQELKAKLKELGY